MLGERLINQYDFYNAFTTGEEFRIVAEGQTLGSLPVERPLTTGQRIIFGGRRWKVLDIDTQGKIIYAIRDHGGTPPAFDGGAGRVHSHVRQEMKRVLEMSEIIPYLDSQATEFLDEARTWFKVAALDTKHWVIDGDGILLLGWQGDSIHDALALLLTARGLPSTNEGVALRVSSRDQNHVSSLLQEIGTNPSPTVFDLKLKADQTTREKWDWALPDDLRLRSFASSHLDLAGAHKLALELSRLPR